MKIKDDFSSQQAKYFDEITESRGGDAFFAENPALAAEFNAIIGSMGDLQGKTILDVGCGSGRHAVRLAALAKEVVGTDISKKSIDLANSTAKKNGLENFKGVVSDYSAPFKTEYFDHAIMVNAVHHIDHPEQVLRSIGQSLRGDGELVIFEFNPLNLLFIPFLVIHGQIRAHLNMKYPRSNIFSLKDLIKKSGLEIVGIEKYAWLPTILYNYSPLFERLNKMLNKIPLVDQLCAFHIIRCKVKK